MHNGAETGGDAQAEMATLLAAVAESTARVNKALDKALEAIERREADSKERHASGWDDVEISAQGLRKSD